MAADEEKAAEADTPHYCRGCENMETCETRQTQATLNTLQTKRTPSGKYHACHSIHAEYVARPPDDKETRRKFGETARQY
jgi:hypothetical protein